MDSVSNHAKISRKEWFIFFSAVVAGICLSACISAVMKSTTDVLKENSPELSKKLPNSDEMTQSLRDSHPAMPIQILALSLPPPDDLDNSDSQEDIKFVEENIEKESMAKQSVSKLANKNVVDATQFDFQNQTHEEQTHWPEITIALPAHPIQRTETIRYLRECVGVTLAQLDRQGNIVNQESKMANPSSFVRLVRGGLSPEESNISRQWGQKAGRLIRIYPAYLDNRLLGGINRLHNGVLNHKKDKRVTISGRYQKQGQQLFLVALHVNNKPVGGEIILAKGC